MVTKITLRRSKLCHVRRRGLVYIMKHEKMLPVVDITKITAKTIVSITTRQVGRSNRSLAAFQLLTFRSVMMNLKNEPKIFRFFLTLQEKLPTPIATENYLKLKEVPTTGHKSPLDAVCMRFTQCTSISYNRLSINATGCELN